MATETWPTSLPDSPDKSNYTSAARNNTVASGMGYGPAKIRRRSTVAIIDVGMQMQVTEAQVNTLNNFYNITLFTTLPFNWIDHTTSLAAVYRFKGPPSYSYFAPGYWLAKMSLEIVPL